MPSARIDCDVTRKLAERITGVCGIFAVRLRNAHQVEAPARTTTHDEWSFR
jgi:hypothetical protein